jgi:hypothetical protein
MSLLEDIKELMQFTNSDYRDMIRIREAVLSLVEFESENKKTVNSIKDFPDPINNVITLEPGKTYIVTTNIDLMGNRLVTSGVCNLFGTSSETSSITSTGLGIGVPLITSEYTIVLENITIKNVTTALSIDGNTNLIALDWENVNFSNIPTVGTINTCDNLVLDTCAFLGAQELTITGNVGTIAINNTLLRGTGETGAIIKTNSNTNITRRFRLNYSSVITPELTTGINFNSLTSVPIEGFILDTVNFSGSSQDQYLSDVNDLSNKALFVNCVNIRNTAVNGQMYMQNNLTPTVVSVQNDWYKVAGITLPSVDNSKVLHSDNRLTIDAVINRKYLIDLKNLSFTSGNNNIVEFGFFDSELNDIRTPSRTKATANASGRAENVSMGCVITGQQGKYIEIWCRNTSAPTNITVESMNIVMAEIK